MKRRDLIQRLIALGAVFLEEGGEHTIYLNPRCRLKLPVPRHREISDGVTRKLLKDASKAG